MSHHAAAIIGFSLFGLQVGLVIIISQWPIATVIWCAGAGASLCTGIGCLIESVQRDREGR